MRNTATATLEAESHRASAATLDGDSATLCVSERQYSGEATAPPAARVSQLSVVICGRLDCRAELWRQLDRRSTGDAVEALPAEATSSDAALVLAAYERFGLDCTEHLFGDWSFALWDARLNRLVLARDATGNSALFWWQDGGLLLFASSLPTLMSAGPVPSRPNARWLAGLLTVFTDPAHPGATAFEGVYAVPPGHLLLAEAGRVELKRWWRPEGLQPLDGTCLPALQSQFLTLYEDAVRQCLQRPGGSVTATLSGGLDSGSVVALAAPLLVAQGQRLIAFVHTPRFDPGSDNPGRTNNEWALAQATARHVGNVQAIECQTVEPSPVEGIRRWLDMCAAPSHAAGNWYWLLDIAARASASGARILLTGQGGNATVSLGGTGNLWPRVFGFEPAILLRELREERSGWLGGLQDRLVKPALRPLWYGLKRACVDDGGIPAWSGFALLNRSLAQELDLHAAMRVARHDPGISPYSPRRMKLLRLGLLGAADNGTAASAELALAHGLAVRDPTRDRRLVELCWRLPDELYWSNSLRRGLIRSAMRDHLPPEVLNCPYKGLQSADLRQQLRACRDDLLGAVQAVSRHPLARRWIDTERLALSARAALADSSLLAPGAVPPVHLMRALAAGMFIARHG